MYDLLKDLRIIEGSAFVAAPLGGLTLAQLGADVIRFDPIGGALDAKRWPLTAEGASLYWAGLNKGKRSIAIDLGSEEGRDLATALITAPGKDAGVFLTNFPTKGWLDYASLKAARDDLIMLNIQGNPDGSTALDYTINCAVGIPFATGEHGESAPVNHMFPAWDVATGISAAVGILAAERHRSQTGKGQRIKLALSDVAMAMVGNLGHIAEAQINGENRPAIGNRLYGAFGRDFVTKDGKRFMVVALTDRQWHTLVQATGLADELAALESQLGVDFNDVGARYQCTDAIAPLVETWSSTKTFGEVANVFDNTGVCWGPYQSFTEMVANDPRCSAENPVFQQVEQPGIGSYLTPGSALHFSALQRRPVRPAPACIGAHSDEVLAEVLRLNDAQIGSLLKRGIVAKG